MSLNDSNSFIKGDSPAHNGTNSSMIAYGQRRRIDIAKRFKTLQTRKERLEQELDSIKRALLTLVNQMYED